MTEPSPTTSTAEVCSLFTIKLALEKLRYHALRVRDTAQSSAIQLAGPSVAREFSRKPELKPDQGINGHLLSIVDDIEAVLSDCDDFAESILVLTGKWHQEQEAAAELIPSIEIPGAVGKEYGAPSSPPSDRTEPTPADEPDIALKTGLADLVSTVAGTRAQSGAGQ